MCGSIFSALLMGLAVVLVLTNYSQYHDNKQRIADYLNDKGAADIVISSKWWLNDRASFTYDVEYTDRQGKRQQVRCKISSWLLGDKTIYWSEPPEV